MILYRLNQLQKSIKYPILIKKKENLVYLLGRSFMHGFLLVRPLTKGAVVFFGDGLEKIEKIKTDRLKYIPLYLTKAKSLQLEDEFTFAEYNYIRQKVKQQKKRVKIEHVKSPVDFQRQVKDAGEITRVKKSMQIVERVFSRVKKEIKKPGMTEERLAKFIRNSGLKMGAEDVSFPAIVASGANAAIPHHVPSSKRLQPGESIIIDFGFKYKNYCSDFTRTVFLKRVHPRLEKAYSQVEKAYEESMELIGRAMPASTGNLKNVGAATSRPLRAGDVYQKAADVLAEHHLDKYFIHSLGHGTGLEIHELPNLSPGSKDTMANGMVFSIEPGVYLPRVGGIRIEDLVYLDKGKVKKFINVPTKLKDNIV